MLQVITLPAMPSSSDNVENDAAPSLVIETGLLHVLDDPMPQHLRGLFINSLVTFFWPIVVGGIVCTALELGLAIAIGGWLPLLMVFVVAVGFLMSITSIWVTRRTDLTDPALVDRLVIAFSVSTVVVGIGVGGMTYLTLSGPNRPEMHLLAFGIAIATLGITNGAGVQSAAHCGRRSAVRRGALDYRLHDALGWLDSGGRGNRHRDLCNHQHDRGTQHLCTPGQIPHRPR